MLKKDFTYLHKFFLIPILFITLNFILVDRNYHTDNNICSSDEHKNTYYFCELCCFDNDSTSNVVKLFKINIFNFQETQESNSNSKIKLIDPKSNSPPVLIFS